MVGSSVLVSVTHVASVFLCAGFSGVPWVSVCFSASARLRMFWYCWRISAACFGVMGVLAFSPGLLDAERRGLPVGISCLSAMIVGAPCECESFGCGFIIGAV